jgi:hypothetical protein
MSIFNCDNDKNHTFIIKSDNFYKRISSNIKICTICYPIDQLRSIKEEVLYEFIKSIYTGEIIQNFRSGIEIDIYLPEMKLGFEFNGIFWHSSKFRERGYHLEKLEHFKKLGIRIVNIWEDDWMSKQEIIKSQINNFLLNSDKIPARKCYVKEIEYSESRDFLERNHIQGSYKQIVKSLGLFYGEDLVSVMTFDHFEGRKKMPISDWNLSRFCNKLNFTVIGGASKMLKFFTKNYQVERVISYADKDWSIGTLYEKIGFEKVHETKPDYKYVVKEKRIHKSNFKKLELIGEILPPKIYDCGKIKYQLIL